MTPPGLDVPKNPVWTFAEDASAEARALLESGRWRKRASVMKANRRRTIYHVPGPPALIVKHDAPPGPLDRLKALWRKAGVREFKAAQAMHDLGLPVPRPIGCAVHGEQSLCVIAELKGCEKLRLAWQRDQNNPEIRGRIIDAITRFAATFAVANVVHPDMHTGNILVREQGNHVTCYLVDLAGAYVADKGRSTSPWQSVGWLTHLSPQLTNQEACDILEVAVVPLEQPAMNLWAQLLRRKAHENAKRWPGRKRRLLGASSLCDEHHTALGHWRVRTAFPLETAEELVNIHQHNAREGALLETGDKQRLSRATHGGESYVVKEFLAPGKGWWRPDRKSWFCHYRIMPDELPACRCYGWLQAADGTGLLILEDLGETNLRSYAQMHRGERLRRHLQATGKLLAWMHLRGIWHRDMKAATIVVTEKAQPLPVAVADCEAVRFDVSFTSEKRRRNLRQLLDTLPPEVPDTEKIRLAVAYRREAGLTRDELRQLLAT